MKYYLSGEGIGLRQMVRADLTFYSEWMCDPEVTKYLEMAWQAPNEVVLNHVFQEATESQNATVFVICEKKTHRPVGTVGLYLIHWPCRRAQFRILIGASDLFDQGIGTEATKMILAYAFNTLNLETVYLGVNAENRRAIRSYEKAGFVKEGTQRRFIFCNGAYYDCVNMGILRSDFESHAKS